MPPNKSTTYIMTICLFVQMIGIELRPMPSFSLEIVPGSKVKVRASCTPMRRGVAMLSPECIVLLEGSVERLVACTATSSGASAPAVIAHALQLPVQQPLQAAVGIHHPRQNHPQVIDPVQNKKVQHQNHQQRGQQQQQQLRSEGGKSLDQSLNQSQRLNPYCSAVDVPLVYGSASEHALAPLLRHAAPNTKSETAAEYQSSVEVVPQRRSVEETMGSIKSVFSSPGHSATNQILDLCSPSSPSPSSPIRIISNQPLATMHDDMNVSMNMSHDALYDELNLNAVTSSPSICTPPQGITVRLAKARSALVAETVHTSPAIVTTILSSLMNGEAAASAGGAGCSGVRSSSSSSSIGGQSETQSNLTYFALDTVAAWLSGPVGSDISFNLPAGDFVVRGTAVNIRKFKVAPSEGYVVLLSLEGEAEANGENMKKASAVVPALVSNDLCSKYLQTTAKEYLLNLKKSSKEEIKEIKTSYSLKFRDFRGTFRARLLPCNPHSKISQSDQAPPNTVMDAHAARSCGASSSSQGDRMLLLLVDFYCSQVT
jgi:RecQ mediated genome instability protein